MSFWSALRRSSPSIHRFTAIQRFQFRQFSAAPPPPESAHFQRKFHDNPKTNILGWISAGIITSSTLALSLYSFSSSSIDSPHVSFADWSAPAPATTAAALSHSSLQSQTNESKFFFGGKATVTFLTRIYVYRLICILLIIVVMLDVFMVLCRSI